MGLSFTDVVKTFYVYIVPLNMKIIAGRKKAFLPTWSTVLSISNPHSGRFGKKIILEQILHDISTP